MTKQEFFDNLHNQLAEKYNLTSHQINSIRYLFLGRKMTRLQVAEFYANKLHNAQLRERIDHYQVCLNVTASISNDIWNDITQKTEFDRK